MNSVLFYTVLVRFSQIRNHISDSTVVRGCVADLDEVEKENCLLNSETCKTCFDFGCNQKVNFSQYYITNESILNDSPQNDDTKRHRNICSNCNDTCFT